MTSKLTYMILVLKRGYRQRITYPDFVIVLLTLEISRKLTYIPSFHILTGIRAEPEVLLSWALTSSFSIL